MCVCVVGCLSGGLCEWRGSVCVHSFFLSSFDASLLPPVSISLLIFSPTLLIIISSYHLSSSLPPSPSRSFSSPYKLHSFSHRTVKQFQVPLYFLFFFIHSFPPSHLHSLLPFLFHPLHLTHPYHMYYSSCSQTVLSSAVQWEIYTVLTIPKVVMMPCNCTTV